MPRPLNEPVTVDLSYAELDYITDALQDLVDARQGNIENGGVDREDRDDYQAMTDDIDRLSDRMMVYWKMYSRNAAEVVRYVDPTRDPEA